MESTVRPATWKILLAFAIIYFVWGSTFLAIRIGVSEVPPFLLAAMRFTLALLLASVTWSFATILTRKLHLPSSKGMSSAAQMLTGGILLFVVAGIAGDMKDFHASAVSVKTWVALAYLILAGSIAGFTAYVWLLHYESPTRVGTYAYVNPVVAVALGYFLGGETVGLRTLLGTLLVLVSVITITTTAVKRKPETETRPVEAGDVTSI